MNILENLRSLVQAMNSQVKLFLVLAAIAVFFVTLLGLYVAERTGARR